MDILEKLLYRELYKKSCYDFCKTFWNIADPDPFIDGKIVKYFCEVFQFMAKPWVKYEPINVDIPKIKKDAVLFDIRQYSDKNHININIPPRHSKSMIFNVLGPVWLWINYPVKVASISHTSGLAKKMNEKRKRILNSELFQELFGDIQLISNSSEYLKDSRGGELYSLNRDSMTGYGADIIINDDLTNAETARKDKEEMNNAWSYFRNTMPSRINDPKKGVIMNIQQRIAPNDITGRILSTKKMRESYIHIIIPAIFDVDTYFVCPISGDILYWKKGQSLWEERYGDYEALRIDVGDGNFETQYLQRSTASESTVLKPDMIIEKSMTEVPPIDNADAVYASHDFPVKDKESSDFLGSTLGYTKNATLYIFDSLEKKMAFVKSIEYVKGIDDYYPGVIQVIEDKANGSPILEQLQDECAGLQAFQPGTASKMQRLESASLYIKNVVFVQTEWNKLTQQYELSPALENLKKRLLSFPFVEHDDVVDSFSMLLLYVFKDKKYRVYGRSFNDSNIFSNLEPYQKIYSNIFFNREGDIWRVCEIGCEYGEHNKLIILREDKFKSNIEGAFIRIKDFAGNKKLLLDCSSQTGLYGTNENGLYIERYEIEDFDKSVVDLNLALDKNLVLIYKNCLQTKLDLESFKYSKSKDETSKYITDKDGFVSCIRNAMKYYGGIN